MPFRFKKSRKNISFSDRILRPIRTHSGYRKWTGKFKNFEEAVFVSLVAFCIGLFMGVLSGHTWSLEPQGYKSQASGPGLFQKMFGPVMSVPGIQPDGSYILSGFDAVSDFKAWSLDAADMEMSPAHPSEGKHAAKIHFYGRTTLAGIRMEEYFDSRYALTNWSGFRAVRFYIYNPENAPIRLIFQLKDAKGKRAKHDLVIPPEQGMDFEVLLSDMQKDINLRKIRQINLFSWKGSDDHEFYLDNVRLVV